MAQKKRASLGAISDIPHEHSTDGSSWGKQRGEALDEQSFSFASTDSLPPAEGTPQIELQVRSAPSSSAAERTGYSGLALS